MTKQTAKKASATVFGIITALGVFLVLLYAGLGKDLKEALPTIGHTTDQTA